MKRILAAALLAAVTTGAAQPSSHLTLDQALAIGREHSNTLAASRARASGAAARASEAGAALLPSVKVEASYRRLSDVPSFAVALPIPGFTPITVFPSIVDNSSLRASLQQPIFTGFRLRSNAEAASRQAEAGEFDARTDEADLIVGITSAYWGLYQAQEVRRAVEENVTRLETYERDTQHLLAAGMATRNDLLRVQSQLSSARLTQIDAENDQQVAAMNLNVLLGRPTETEIVLTSAPGAAGDSVQHVAGDLTATALALRPDVAAVNTRVSASRASVSAARGGWWPQIALSANYYYSNPNSRYMPARNEWKDSWDVGVQLQFDVWNWGATAAQVEQAQATLAANEALQRQMKENVTLDVQKAVLAVHRASRKLDVARIGVAQAEENSRSMGDKFRSGLATSSELLDASVALLQARASLTGAQVEAEIARVKLRRAAGTLQVGTPATKDSQSNG